MPVVITAQATIEIGAAEPVQGNAPECDLAAVFEDDGDTGYFYALDFSQPEQPIQNALHHRTIHLGECAGDVIQARADLRNFGHERRIVFR